LHGHVTAQCAVVVQVFSAQGQSIYPLAQHVGHSVFDQQRVAWIGYAMGRCLQQTQFAVSGPSNITPPSGVMLAPSKQPSTIRLPSLPNSILLGPVSSVQFGIGAPCCV
jgi:hypothetical protein